MPKKKPLRTIKVLDLPPDHFTFEEAQAVVLKYMREHGIPIRRDVVERVYRRDLGKPVPPPA